ncbi:PIG-L family deacetylase [Pseudomonas sp. SWI6]|uniref:PIG-L family deacetylase n=1 Tax=Pseudomonas taiwanensis TaxID=470150 RepID=A0ABR6V2K9_9PSED|nr:MULTISPECIES: PIG-L family deacetylase [Pseudomonas]AGZ33309.1 LmbE family protein [Pseudomonas sp. VLB120]AVD85104.1 PIG-L family deacetylase [Pseudomonas sp. SWI6]AVD87336.1 PIG-L family deacetylase [Pseudomonas sp. SWI44]MBC3474737.1 PIG-L family deacetylase [Pseudomonas taiwanensis]MBC3491350.1 PIG-L family deacetylase [Pseudomonas taiwanensis]
MSRKQQLLKRHRRNKRLGLLASLGLLLALGWLTWWWLALLLLPVLWAAHEAWFADHLFYTPGEDYVYRFGDQTREAKASLQGGTLRTDAALNGDETLVLQVRVKSRWLGRFLDPRVELFSDGGQDSQAFERGVDGVRFLNLTGLAAPLQAGKLRLRGRCCRLQGEPRLWITPSVELQRRRVMVIAPHADDAELAAYGLYSQADETWVVTLTAGEIEAEHYQRMGMSGAEAARLKGRLRAWDSIAVPRWAGVPESRCVQLGYFCLQLPAMQAAPDQPAVSREAEMVDIRPFRQFNPFPLPADSDGRPTWNNLLADLRALLELARPEVLVMPHPQLDPHPDHICAQAAVLEALQGLAWQPQTLLCYANHLHDNDRWPMGDSGDGVALPPQLSADQAWAPCSLVLDVATQRDKAMALGMMHDLQPPAPFKRRVRRLLQRWLAGRRPSPYGENEFFRKAVRRHELFWRREL